MDSLTEDSRPIIAPSSPRVRRPRPLLTYLLIAANVVVFLAQNYRWGIDVAIARYGQDQIAVWDGEIWRLATAPFLHGFWTHLIVNCLGLLLVGEIVEWRFGKWRLLVAYSLSGLAGGLVFQAFPAAAGVGASGAVYGLIGVLLVMRFGHLVEGRFRLRRAFFVVGALLPLIDWLFAEMMARTTGLQVATSAHLGGYLCGAVLGYLFVHPESISARRRWGLSAAGTAVLIGLFVYGCFYPVLNPLWPLWKTVHAGVEKGAIEPEDLRRLADLARSEQVFGRLTREVLERGKELEARGREAEAGGNQGEARRYFLAAEERYQLAIRVWENFDAESLEAWPLKLDLGYRLYDELMGVGVDRLAKEVLTRLVDGTLELRNHVVADEEAPWKLVAHLSNQLAWFLALQGDDSMKEALLSAQLAVRLVREHASEGLPFFADDSRRMESAYLNTLGWVQFIMADDIEAALKNLRQAAELAPLGPNFLYLAIAYARLGDDASAIDTARRAEEAGGLSAHEERLLRELKHDVGM